MSDCFKHGWRSAQGHCPDCSKPKEETKPVEEKPKQGFLSKLFKRDK